MNDPRPIDSPLTAGQLKELDRLLESLTQDQLQWVSGYLAGLSAGREDRHTPDREPAPPAPSRRAAEEAPLTVLFGSETGNAEALAGQAAELAGDMGLPVRVMDMGDYKARDLRNERQLLIVTATHGEGDPPDGARDFYEFLHGRKAPRLDGTRFAVLALGDSSYEHFCQTGRDIDARLEALGGERIRDRLDCDVDYEEDAGQWLKEGLQQYSELLESGAQRNVITLDTGRRPAPAKPRYDRKHPFAAEVLDTVVLSGRGSAQEILHVELSLEGSGLEYQPGDVLGVVAENRPELVSEIITGLGLDPDEPVPAASGDTEIPLAEALRRDRELTLLTPGLVEAWARLGGFDTLRELAGEGRRGELMAFIQDRQLIDLVNEYPLEGVGGPSFVSMLRRLQPREYSIASSHLANPGEVHLTVAAVRYQHGGQERYGLASTYLADIAVPGERVPVYVRSNKNFKLPGESSTPVVMIGPGTGVAPFRAFMQEREEQEAGGDNWLFFGNPRFRTDFLYQVEWQRWLADGLLTRLDLAFSRDQGEKVYVQHRMREHAQDLYDWIEAGAHLYVCGDADRMAKDVHKTLEEIIAEQGKLGQDEARDYINRLQREKRYQRDVY